VGERGWQVLFQCEEAMASVAFVTPSSAFVSSASVVMLRSRPRFAHVLVRSFLCAQQRICLHPCKASRLISTGQLGHISRILSR
jgi:hypothetical protein